MIKLFTQEQLDYAKTRDLLTLECEYCHAHFQATKKSIINKKRKNGKRFCSVKCSSKNQGKQSLLNCCQCKTS